MGIREKIGEMFYKRLNRKIGEKVRSGMSALLSNNQWESGSFVVEVATVGTITVYVHPINDGNQAEVYAETNAGNTSRDWSIPKAELEAGIDSAVGAVYDVTYGKFS